MMVLETMKNRKEGRQMEYCEMCDHTPCQCDRDDNNPVDVSSEKLAEIYADPDYDMDHDHSMDY